MATTDELEAKILEDAVSGITSTSVDGMSVNRQSLKDRLDALSRLKQGESLKKDHMGLYYRQLVPPGGGGT